MTTSGVATSCSDCVVVDDLGVDIAVSQCDDVDDHEARVSVEQAEQVSGQATAVGRALNPPPCPQYHPWDLCQTDDKFVGNPFPPNIGALSYHVSASTKRFIAVIMY